MFNLNELPLPLTLHWSDTLNSNGFWSLPTLLEKTRSSPPTSPESKWP